MGREAWFEPYVVIDERIRVCQSFFIAKVDARKRKAVSTELLIIKYLKILPLAERATVSLYNSYGANKQPKLSEFVIVLLAK